jgi:hypothetical protein
LGLPSQECATEQNPPELTEQRHDKLLSWRAVHGIPTAGLRSPTSPPTSAHGSLVLITPRVHLPEVQSLFPGSSDAQKIQSVGNSTSAALLSKFQESQDVYFESKALLVQTLLKHHLSQSPLLFPANPVHTFFKNQPMVQTGC